MSATLANDVAASRLASVKAPWLSGAVGLSVISVAFVVSVVNASLESPNAFISRTQMPFIFVGIGLLLYHIGLHVHAVHQNVILMASSMDVGTQASEPQGPRP
jgi:hypothetical protein